MNKRRLLKTFWNGLNSIEDRIALLDSGSPEISILRNLTYTKYNKDNQSLDLLVERAEGRGRTRRPRRSGSRWHGLRYSRSYGLRHDPNFTINDPLPSRKFSSNMSYIRYKIGVDSADRQAYTREQSFLSFIP